jgi:hypothetical protein
MKSKIESDLAKLKSLSACPPSELAKGLSEFYTSSCGVVLKKVFDLLKVSKLQNLEPPTEACFARLLKRPLKQDPGCLGKEAILRYILDAPSGYADLLLHSIHYVQLEPVWGGHEDSASVMRGLSALALVRSQHPDAPTRVANLIADDELPARRGAFEALCEAPPIWGQALLVVMARFEGDVQLRADLQTFLLEESVMSVASLMRDLDSERVEYREAACIALSLVPSIETALALLERLIEEVAPLRRRDLWGVFILASRVEDRAKWLPDLGDLGSTRIEEALQAAREVGDQEMIESLSAFLDA